MDNTTQSSGRRLVQVACVLAAIKLCLVASNEMLALPYDSEQYVRLAEQGAWRLGATPPGYPMWLYITQFTGIPQRIAIELLFILASLFFANALRTYFGLRAAVISLGLLLFAPTTYYLLDLALSDGFYAVLTLITLAICVRLTLSPPDSANLPRYGVALGVAVGVMAITRLEDPLLLLSGLALFIGLASTPSRSDVRAPARAALVRSALVTVSAAATAALLVFSVSAIHYFTDGVSARAYSSMSGHAELLGNLAAIDTGEKTARYVPISGAARALGYQVSPTLRKYRATIEDPGNTYQSASRNAGFPAGEIGAGWIWHVFNNALFNQLPGAKPASIEAEYSRINSELVAGFKEGTLKRRFVIHPLIGGDVRELLGGTVNSLPAVIMKSFATIPYTEDQAHEAGLFDRVLWRRAALTYNEPLVTVQGWALVQVPGMKISKILIGTERERYASVEPMPRPDVETGYSRHHGWTPVVEGFRAKIQARSASRVFAQYTLDNGLVIVADNLKNGEMRVLTNPNQPDVSIVQGIDIAEAAQDSPRRSWRQRAQLTISKWWQAGQSFGASVLGMLATVSIILAWMLRKHSWWRSVGLLVMLFQALWLLRILFYSLIEASAWSIDTRYLASAQVIVLCWLSVIIGAILSRLRRPSGHDGSIGAPPR